MTATPDSRTLLDLAITNHDLSLELHEKGTEAAQARNNACKQLHAEGWSLREIGDELGVGRQRVAQMIRDAR